MVAAEGLQAGRLILAIKHIVVTGLVPVTSLRLARCLPKRDGQDEPGHDTAKFVVPFLP
jgi:hypothetical protein